MLFFADRQFGSDANRQRQSNDSVWVAICQQWRTLAGFSLLFRIFEGLLCAPLIALVGKWLLDRTVLDSTAVVSFLLSTRGVLACVFGATAVLTIRLVEHAGLSTIFFGAFNGQRVLALEAARIVWRYLLGLLGVSVRFVGLGLLTVLPLLTVAGGFAGWLLQRHDLNYYLKLRPPEFIVAAVVIRSRRSGYYGSGNSAGGAVALGCPGSAI